MEDQVIIDEIAYVLDMSEDMDHDVLATLIYEQIKEKEPTNEEK